MWSRTCAVFNSAAGQTTTSSDDVAINWDVEVIKDSIYIHNSAVDSSRIQVIEKGTYRVSGCINYYGTTSNYRYTTRVSIRVNGTAIASSTFSGSYIRAATGSNYSGCFFSLPLQLETNAYFEILTKRISSNAGNAVVGAGTNLSVERMC